MTNNLLIDESTIYKIFKSFHTITKLRIVLYDNKYQQIISYPNNDCKFCSIIHTINSLNNLCVKYNYDAFKQAEKQKGLYIYHCHAGLIEASYPLTNDKGIILGYLMIGQVSDGNNYEDTIQHLKAILNNHEVFLDDYHDLLFTPNKSIEEIEAATTILEACTLYLDLKKSVEYDQNTFIENLNKYINLHLKDNLSIDIIKDDFYMNKNALYNAFNEYSKLGIAEYIKRVRLEKAKYYLKNTNYSVKKIADDVGFSDYNYFCRTFKKYYKISAKQYRLSTQK